jgi:hypothetical protein
MTTGERIAEKWGRTYGLSHDSLAKLIDVEFKAELEKAYAKGWIEGTENQILLADNNRKNNAQKAAELLAATSVPWTDKEARPLSIKAIRDIILNP